MPAAEASETRARCAVARRVIARERSPAFYACTTTAGRSIPPASRTLTGAGERKRSIPSGSAGGRKGLESRCRLHHLHCRQRIAGRSATGSMAPDVLTPKRRDAVAANILDGVKGGAGQYLDHSSTRSILV